MKKFSCLLIFAVFFICCATSNETVFDPGDAASADSNNFTCNLNNCSTPPFAGAIKCCTSSNTCGYKTSEAGACYGFEAGNDGSAGSGGQSN